MRDTETRDDRIVIARADVWVYARRVALGTATIGELAAAFERYDEARGVKHLKRVDLQDVEPEGAA